MNQTLQTVTVVARLAGAASEHGKLQEFIGYLIGAFAASNTELVKHDEDKAVNVLANLADATLALCGEVPSNATVQ